MRLGSLASLYSRYLLFPLLNGNKRGWYGGTSRYPYFLGHFTRTFPRTLLTALLNIRIAFKRVGVQIDIPAGVPISSRFAYGVTFYVFPGFGLFFLGKFLRVGQQRIVIRVRFHIWVS